MAAAGIGGTAGDSWSGIISSGRASSGGMMSAAAAARSATSLGGGGGGDDSAVTPTGRSAAPPSPATGLLVHRSTDAVQLVQLTLSACCRARCAE